MTLPEASCLVSRTHDPRKPRIPAIRPLANRRAAGSQLLVHTFYRASVEWTREWVYELRWAPGCSGVLSRGVDSVEKLRAVVTWARSNPHVEKCSYRLEYRTRGERIERCSLGHSLLETGRWQPYRLEQKMRFVRCADCPGHYISICPECGTPAPDPPAGPDCTPE